MSLRSPTENEIALTPTQRTGRGVRSEEFLSYPRPLCGKGERLLNPAPQFSEEEGSLYGFFPFSAKTEGKFLRGM